jgi:hypothetical protein
LGLKEGIFDIGLLMDSLISSLVNRAIAEARRDLSSLSNREGRPIQ